MAAQADQWLNDNPEFPCLTGQALLGIQRQYLTGKRKRGAGE